MSDIVRIMPRQPIEAEIGDGRYWPTPESGLGCSYFPADHWAEVSDPIVWDGTDETRHELHLALGERWYVDIGDGLHITSRADSAQHVRVSSGWRIRIEGDTFAILPPKDGDA